MRSPWPDSKAASPGRSADAPRLDVGSAGAFGPPCRAVPFGAALACPVVSCSACQARARSASLASACKGSGPSAGTAGAALPAVRPWAFVPWSSGPAGGGAGPSTAWRRAAMPASAAWGSPPSTPARTWARSRARAGLRDGSAVTAAWTPRARSGGTIPAGGGRDAAAPLRAAPFVSTGAAAAAAGAAWAVLGGVVPGGVGGAAPADGTWPGASWPAPAAPWSGPSSGSSSIAGSALMVKSRRPAARITGLSFCSTAGATALLSVIATGPPLAADTRPNRRLGRSRSRPPAWACAFMSAITLRGFLRRSSRITAWRSFVRATAQDAGLRSARFSAARKSAGDMRLLPPSSSPLALAPLPSVPQLSFFAATALAAPVAAAAWVGRLGRARLASAGLAASCACPGIM